MHEDVHCCDGPSGLSLQHGHPDASVDALRGVAGCHCTLSMARKAVFIVFNVVIVFSEFDGSSGDSAEWTVRPRASVRKGNSMNWSLKSSVFSLKRVGGPLLLTSGDRQHHGSWRSLLTHHRIGRRPEGLLSIQAPPSGSRAEPLVIGSCFRVQN